MPSKLITLPFRVYTLIGKRVAQIAFLFKLTIIYLDTFTSIITKKFMIWLFSRVRHYLTITLRNPADKRGFFYLNNDFIKIPTCLFSLMTCSITPSKAYNIKN
ncbi:hypothetical protein COF82_13925 [Bacillus wiedmannii]|nr:hypothetical protein CON91_30520 [Bacillus wiedmannii]PEI30911.1 hypothetical protein CN644_31335 [Bacillus wiedmannii]PFZ06484.1 hypothetical protein COL75_03245 [Bacillus wiedmannii]PGB63569.1 hypothetical protein COM15_27480 [Bacillus wiedmannii]PHF30184.1 hypothetical protein COF82_13925 [Bacillus wiedmannii]